MMTWLRCLLCRLLDHRYDCVHVAHQYPLRRLCCRCGQVVLS